MLSSFKIAILVAIGALLFACGAHAAESQCNSCTSVLQPAVSAICRATIACKVSASPPKAFFALDATTACFCDCNEGKSNAELQETCGEALVESWPWGLIATFQDDKWVANSDVTRERTRDARFVPSVLLDFEQGVRVLSSAAYVFKPNGSSLRRADQLVLGDIVQVSGLDAKVKSVKHGNFEFWRVGFHPLFFFGEILNVGSPAHADYEYLLGIGTFHARRGDSPTAPEAGAVVTIAQDVHVTGIPVSSVVTDFERVFKGFMSFWLVRRNDRDSYASSIPVDGGFTCLREVDYSEGLVTRETSHPGALAAILAHEVGHHYARIEASGKALCSKSCEAHSDYWGALVAYRVVYPSAEGAIALRNAQASLRDLFPARGDEVSDQCIAHPPAACRFKNFDAAARGEPFPSCDVLSTAAAGSAF